MRYIMAAMLAAIIGLGVVAGNTAHAEQVDEGIQISAGSCSNGLDASRSDGCAVALGDGDTPLNIERHAYWSHYECAPEYTAVANDGTRETRRQGRIPSADGLVWLALCEPTAS